MIGLRFILCTLIFSFLTTKGQDIRRVEYLEVKKVFKNYISNHSNFHQNEHHNLHYLKWGKDNDPTILWLHGSFSNAIEIEPFAKDFVSANFQVISLDYYGHGLTKVPQHSYSLETFLDGILNLLKDLKIDNIIIGGFSRGGYIASCFYDKYPDRVKALILEDSGVSPFLYFLENKNEEELKSFVAKELMNRPSELFNIYDNEVDAYYAIREFSDTSKTQQFKNFFFIQQHNEKYQIYSGLDTIYGMQSSQSLEKLSKAELYSNPFANELMLRDYNRIIDNSTIPILLMEACSSDDEFDDKMYYQNLKNSNLVHKRFEKSSHNIKYAQPKEFIETVQSFLKTIF